MATWKKIQTSEHAVATYRTIVDSYDKSEVYTKSEADGFHSEAALVAKLADIDDLLIIEASSGIHLDGNGNDILLKDDTQVQADLTVDNTFTASNGLSIGQQIKTIDSANISGTMNLSFSAYSRFRIGIDTVATGDCTLTFTAPHGPCNITLIIVQGASTTFTLTWPATVKWPGGTAPTLSTANNAIDVVTLVWDNTAGGDGIYYGQVGNNFS